MLVFAGIGRLWETIKPLKPVQLYGRLAFRITRVRPNLSPPPIVSNVGGEFELPARRAPSLTENGELNFLNVPGDLNEIGWNGSQRSLLWRYNQHYFDDLNAFDASERSEIHRHFIARWIAENPPGSGVGWEPYPTSLRIVNWVKWKWRGACPPEGFDESLAVQARWLAKRLEWHLLGNHLFSNAKALLFAGCYFSGPEAANWRTVAFDILRREIAEQFLTDGAHFELSPMYHALACEDLIDLQNLAKACAGTIPTEIVQLISARIKPALNWLGAMSHPDGQFAYFNDAARGVAPANSEIAAYADRIGFAAETRSTGSAHLAPSGYVRLEVGSAVVLCDFADVGPSYIPGHAHADTLSFEMSLNAQRIFVNSGTSVYGVGPERLRQRSTAAHNTVEIAERNSSDVWSGFRVGRRAKTFDIQFDATTAEASASGAHDGYRFLPNRPMHRRYFRLTRNSLVISDQVEPNAPARAYYRLHPDIRVIELEPNRATLRIGDFDAWIYTGRGTMDWFDATYHPAFGVSIPTLGFSLDVGSGDARMEISWK